MAIDAPEDALREFRQALGLDPDLAEVREQAEAARRRIARPREPRDETRLSRFLTGTGHLVPLVAGIAAAIVVFTVGALLIAYRASPRAQRLRAHTREMEQGRELYAQGRYAEAYDHFARAAQLDPTSQAARRRAQDAARVAGIRTQGVAPPNALRPAQAGTAAAPRLTIETPILPSAWVGPRPDTTPPPTSPPSRPARVPPPLDVPDPLGSNNASADLPPIPPGPSFPAADEGIAGGSRLRVNDPVEVSDDDIGQPAVGAAEPDEAVEAPKPRRTGGSIRIERHPPKRATEPTTEASAGPKGEDLRTEAQRLWDAGRPAEAAARFAEAATRYREEAAEAGPGQAAKRQAARSCDLARQACESQLQ
jgi:tetratricopeptide (TPR) repeat protein